MISDGLKDFIRQALAAEDKTTIDRTHIARNIVIEMAAKYDETIGGRKAAHDILQAANDAAEATLNDARDTLLKEAKDQLQKSAQAGFVQGITDEAEQLFKEAKLRAARIGSRRSPSVTAALSEATKRSSSYL